MSLCQLMYMYMYHYDRMFWSLQYNVIHTVYSCVWGIIDQKSSILVISLSGSNRKAQSFGRSSSMIVFIKDITHSECTCKIVRVYNVQCMHLHVCTLVLLKLGRCRFCSSKIYRQTYMYHNFFSFTHDCFRADNHRYMYAPLYKLRHNKS